MPFVQKFYKQMIVVVAAIFIASLASMTMGASAAKPDDKGFDEFGYNRSARVFVGTCKSWYMGKYNPDEVAAENYCGVYSNDKLVMKWNAAWDACNLAGNDDEETCAGAWLNNEWNGMVPGGSGETEHFKAVWITPESCGVDGTPLDDGGYCIWGHYEAIMDFYGPGKPDWQAHASPSGYGIWK